MAPTPSNKISSQSMAIDDAVTMRRATAADAARLRALAQLDDKRLPTGPFLVADVAGEIVAAVSIPTRIAVADPFRPTADAVAMLRLRAAQVSAPVAPALVQAGRLAARTHTAAVVA